MKSSLDEMFFNVWDKWDGSVGNSTYNSLINLLLEGAYANVVTKLKQKQVYKDKEQEKEKALDVVMRLLPRLILKKKSGWKPKYGPVALTSMDAYYVLFNKKQQQIDKECFSFEEMQNTIIEEEEDYE